MKNKKAEQERQRQERKNELQEAKHIQRNASPSLERTEGNQAKRKKILIVCEGKNTEPSYFTKFRVPTIQIECDGGYEPLQVVKTSIRKKAEKQWDEIWCVFDRDEHQNFEEALELAKAKKLKVAYSNQAFEYWLLLHFNDHQGGAMHRNEYNTKLNDCINAHGVSYDGNGSKIVSDKLFNLMLSIDPKTKQARIDLAIARARRIIKQHRHTPPSEAESSTTVHELVENIRNNNRKYL